MRHLRIIDAADLIDWCAARATPTPRRWMDVLPDYWLPVNDYFHFHFDETWMTIFIFIIFIITIHFHFHDFHHHYQLSSFSLPINFHLFSFDDWFIWSDFHFQEYPSGQYHLLILNIDFEFIYRYNIYFKYFHFPFSSWSVSFPIRFIFHHHEIHWLITISVFIAVSPLSFIPSFGNFNIRVLPAFLPLIFRSFR